MPTECLGYRLQIQMGEASVASFTELLHEAEMKEQPRRQQPRESTMCLITNSAGDQIIICPMTPPTSVLAVTAFPFVPISS